MVAMVSTLSLLDELPPVTPQYHNNSWFLCMQVQVKVKKTYISWNMAKIAQKLDILKPESAKNATQLKHATHKMKQGGQFTWKTIF